MRDTGDGSTGIGFSWLPLSRETLEGIASLGYEVPTEVQAACIEPILAGKDLVVQSRTGTGKTSAFGIPIVEKVSVGNTVKALVMAPTRELALQVAQEISRLGRAAGTKVLAVYGGVGYKNQLDGLNKGTQVVVGTPGRILDHLDRKTLDLSNLQILVLDEADEMLSRGFLPDIMEIISRCPASRQTLLFSATVPEDIERIASRHMKSPLRIELSGDQVVVQSIRNRLYLVEPTESRPRQLLALIETEEPESAIVFCNTKSDTELVTSYLVRRGYDAALLNSDLQQARREKVMAKVKAGELRFLVATDIAARGIDISDLSHVIHYSLPEDPHVYIHRSGRTGRVGKVGVAAALYSPRDLRDVFTKKKLEERFKVAFKVLNLPSRKETLAMLAERRLKDLKAASCAVLTEEHLMAAKAILEDQDAERLVACLLQDVDRYRHENAARELGIKGQSSSNRERKKGRGRRKGRHR